jgi:hypothetical protein
MYIYTLLHLCIERNKIIHSTRAVVPAKNKKLVSDHTCCVCCTRWRRSACMYVCMYVCMYSCMYRVFHYACSVCACMYVYMYVCMYVLFFSLRLFCVCLYVCTYVCMHVCIVFSTTLAVFVAWWMYPCIMMSTSCMHAYEYLSSRAQTSLKAPSTLHAYITICIYIYLCIYIYI